MVYRPHRADDIIYTARVGRRYLIYAHLLKLSTRPNFDWKSYQRVTICIAQAYTIPCGPTSTDKAANDGARSFRFRSIREWKALGSTGDQSYCPLDFRIPFSNFRTPRLFELIQPQIWYVQYGLKNVSSQEIR